MSIVSLHKRRAPTGSASTAPARIVLYVNGTRRELLPTDRVADIARIARASHKLTGQPARLSCSGWDWGATGSASHEPAARCD